MSNLRKKLAILDNKEAKPRAQKKEVVMSVRMHFEVYNDNFDEAKDDCRRFKDWVKNEYTDWDKTVLEHFLYAHNLIQDDEDGKYVLNMHIDKIIKDESSTASEQREFMQNVEKEEEDKK